MSLLRSSDKNVLVCLSVIIIVSSLNTCSSALIGLPYISTHTRDVNTSLRRPFKARVKLYPSDYRVNPPLQEVDPLGWLTAFEQYKTSQSKAAARDQPLLSSPDQFRRVEWYWGGVGEGQTPATTSHGHGVTAPRTRPSPTTTAPGEEEPTADAGSDTLPATKKPFVFTLDTANKIIITPKIYKKCPKGKKLDGNGVCRKVWTCSNGRC